MTLNSFASQTMTSFYDPTDQEHVYNMSHPQRGHFVVINNRHFRTETGKCERSGSDVDAANLFATFKQLGFHVELKSNLTCHQMLRLAIDCKLFSLFIFKTSRGISKSYIFDKLANVFGFTPGHPCTQK